MRSSTDADGNVLFYDLLGGTYTITESIPGDAADTIVFCSYVEVLEQNASFTYVPGGISLDVPSGSDIVCDWYNIPLNLRGDPGDAPGEGSSVTVHARLCPPGYTGDQPFDVCHDTPKTNRTFTLDNLLRNDGSRWQRPVLPAQRRYLHYSGGWPGRVPVLQRFLLTGRGRKLGHSRERDRQWRRNRDAGEY